MEFALEEASSCVWVCVCVCMFVLSQDLVNARGRVLVCVC